MLTAKNPECSRCCRFVGTQFESGRDYGEHGMGSTVWGARNREHGMGSTDKAYMPELVERIQYSTGLIYFNAEVQILL